jgi:hypothetical protein
MAWRIKQCHIHTPPLTSSSVASLCCPHRQLGSAAYLISSASQLHCARTRSDQRPHLSTAEVSNCRAPAEVVGQRNTSPRRPAHETRESCVCRHLDRSDCRAYSVGASTLETPDLLLHLPAQRFATAPPVSSTITGAAEVTRPPAAEALLRVTPQQCCSQPVLAAPPGYHQH